MLGGAFQPSYFFHRVGIKDHGILGHVIYNDQVLVAPEEDKVLVVPPDLETVLDQNPGVCRGAAGAISRLMEINRHENFPVKVRNAIRPLGAVGHQYERGFCIHVARSNFSRKGARASDALKLMAKVYQLGLVERTLMIMIRWAKRIVAAMDNATITAYR